MRGFDRSVYRKNIRLGGNIGNHFCYFDYAARLLGKLSDNFSAFVRAFTDFVHFGISKGNFLVIFVGQLVRAVDKPRDLFAFVRKIFKAFRNLRHTVLDRSYVIEVCVTVTHYI